jgi:hypothetical protein
MSTPNPIAVTATMLDEFALAVSELGSRREVGELRWPELGPEQKVLKDLFRQRIALIPGAASADVCNLAAFLTLDAMIAQHLHDLKLASRAQAKFGGRPGG